MPNSHSTDTKYYPRDYQLNVAVFCSIREMFNVALLGSQCGTIFYFISICVPDT